RHLPVTARARALRGIKNISQMMRHTAALCNTRLGGADVKSAIQLRGIASDNFTAKALCQPDPQRGFARCRRSNDGNEKWLRVLQIHRNKRCRARTKIKMRTKSARRRLPTTWLRWSFIGKRLR